jgi:hypothetical protein
MGVAAPLCSSLVALRKHPIFTAPARAALEWVEIVTLVHEGGIIPHIICDEAEKPFNENELSDLTLAVI